MLWNGNRTHDKLEKWESNPWILIQNGNWTQGNCLKSGKLNPCIYLLLGIEPMTCWCCELEQKSLFPKFSSESMTKRCEFKLYHWLNMRIETRTYSSVKSKPYPRCPKGDSNSLLCCKVDSKQYKCSNLGIEPMNHVLWDKILVYLIKIFLNFYTLVMVFVHYGAVIIAYYEAVHCLFGHHKFGWSSLHRCMRSV
jgi:hypothetical protein